MIRPSLHLVVSWVLFLQITMRSDKSSYSRSTYSHCFWLWSWWGTCQRRDRRPEGRVGSRSFSTYGSLYFVSSLTGCLTKLSQVRKINRVYVSRKPLIYGARVSLVFLVCSYFSCCWRKIAFLSNSWMLVRCGKDPSIDLTVCNPYSAS